MVMLAKQYDGQDPTGWWMSEKLDGVRAIWTGTKLISRTGKEFAAPAWFIAGLPADVTLDGELWEGRGLFQQTCGKVRTQIEPDWTGVKYMVFDCITEGTFKYRMAILSQIELPVHVVILQQIPCKGKNHLDLMESQILEIDGEGLMLRWPYSLYENKRSNSLLKVKRFKTDEAIVTGYETGQGRNQGVVGALLCRMGQKLFKVETGLSDELRRHPPAVGSTITFSYFELTDAGLPRFPAFIGERNEAQKKW